MHMSSTKNQIPRFGVAGNLKSNEVVIVDDYIPNSAEIKANNPD